MTYANNMTDCFFRALISKQKHNAYFSKRKLYFSSPLIALALARGWMNQYSLPAIFLLVIRKKGIFACVFQAGPALSGQSRMTLTRSEALYILKGTDYQHETFCITRNQEYVNLDLDIHIEHLARDLYG